MMTPINPIANNHDLPSSNCSTGGAGHESEEEDELDDTPNEEQVSLCKKYQCKKNLFKLVPMENKKAPCYALYQKATLPGTNHQNLKAENDGNNLEYIPKLFASKPSHLICILCWENIDKGVNRCIHNCFVKAMNGSLHLNMVHSDNQEVQAINKIKATTKASTKRMISKVLDAMTQGNGKKPNTITRFYSLPKQDKINYTLHTLHDKVV